MRQLVCEMAILSTLKVDQSPRPPAGRSASLSATRARIHFTGPCAVIPTGTAWSGGISTLVSAQRPGRNNRYVAEHTEETQ
jgi:hypothetical protein